MPLPPPPPPLSAPAAPPPPKGGGNAPPKKKWATVQAEHKMPTEKLLKNISIICDTAKTPTTLSNNEVLDVALLVARELDNLTESVDQNCVFIAQQPQIVDALITISLSREFPGSLQIITSDIILHLASCNALCRQRLVDDGIIPMTLEVLMNCPSYNVEVCNYFFNSLAMLALEHADTIHDASCTPHVAKLLSSDVPKIRESAAQTLGNLAFGSEEIQVCIAQEGAIPYLVKMLSMGFGSVAAAGSLWSLSFNVRCREELMACGGVRALETYLAEQQKEYKAAEDYGITLVFGVAAIKIAIRYCKGALFVLKSFSATDLDGGKKGLKQEAVEESSDKPMKVMLSYNWEHQELVKKIAAGLQEAGVEVWLDVEQMSGSTLEAMALAVEGADAVVVCMSKNYKQSQACRTEAEYAYCQRKCIVPLKVEESFRPSGWLGALVGSKLYFDFSTRDFKEVLAEVQDELVRATGRKQARSENNGKGSSGCSKGQSVSTPAATTKKRPQAGVREELAWVRGWEMGDVTKWLEAEQLGHLAERFKQHNIKGGGLVELAAWLCEGSPQNGLDLNPYLHQLLPPANPGDLLEFIASVRRLLTAQ